MGVVRSNRSIRQSFNPVERMWTFYCPEMVPAEAVGVMVENVKRVQEGRKLDCLVRFGVGPRLDAFKDSIKAINEGRFRLVVAPEKNKESFAFKQTVGTGKAFSLPSEQEK